MKKKKVSKKKEQSGKKVRTQIRAGADVAYMSDGFFF